MATVQEAIRRLTIEATTRGVKEAEQAAHGLATAMDGVAVASQKTERATQSTDSAFQRARRRYDATVRGQQEFLRVLKLVDAAEGQNIGTQQQRLALLQSVADAVERQAAAAGRYAGAFDMATSIGKSAQESASVFAAELDRMEEIARLKAGQIGAAFGADLEARLVAGASQSARESASVFAAELDRLDEIARLKAEQAGRNFQAALNASFRMGAQPGSARSSAAVFEEAAREAADFEKRVAALKDQINPAGAALDRMNAELAEYSAMATRGALNADELAKAQSIARSRYEATTAAINQQTAAMHRGHGAFQTSNLAAQFQDIAVTAAMGMSPFQIALQQGTQLSAVIQEMQSPVRGLAAAFMAIVNPVSLITIGVIAAGAALYQYFTAGDEGLEKVNDSMRSHEELIARLRDRYGEAAAGIQAYIQESSSELARAARQVEAANRAIVSSTAQEAIDQMLSVSADVIGRQTPLFGEFVGALNDLEESVRRNNPALLEFRQRMIDIEQSGHATDEQRAFASALIATTDAGYQAARALPQAGQQISDVAARAAAGVSSVMSFANALVELGNQIPNIARAHRAQEALQKNTEIYSQQRARLEEQARIGTLSDAMYSQQLEKLTSTYRQAQIEASGLGDAQRQLNEKERAAAIGGMSQREASIARIRDQYAKLQTELKEAGASQVDLDRAAAAMNAEIATSSARFDEMASKAGSRGAARALKDAEREMQAFITTAQRLSDRMFPGNAARQEAEELAAALAQYGDKLSDLERIAVQARIDDQFKAAALGVRELTEETEAASDMASTLADTFTGLFTEPMKDADAFFKRMADGFARLGESNLQKGFEQLFSGKGLPGFSGGPSAFQANTTLLDVIKGIPADVQKGAADGTAAGAQSGLAGMFQGLFSGKSGQMINAGLGGLGMGYQSQNPLMGALGGALQGLMTGNPIGAVVGGIAGLIGGLFGQNDAQAKKQREAAAQLTDSAAAIQALIDQGMGRGVGAYRQQSVEYVDQMMDVRRTARKAGDRDLIREVDAAIDSFNKSLRVDFVGGFRGTIEAMEAGLGSSSPVVQAQQSMIALREELRNFISDADWAQHGMKTARLAARDYALSVLTGAEELSPFAAEMQRVQGTAAGLKVTLTELGMGAEQADKAIRDGLKKAIAELRDRYREEVGASINDLSGRGFLNEMAEAQKLYNDRLADAEALGISASLANREYALSLASIASDAGITEKALRRYARELEIPVAIFRTVLKEFRADNAEKWASTLQDLQGRLLSITVDTDTLAGQMRLYNREARIERKRLEEAGATNRVLIAFDRATNAERRAIAQQFAEEQARMRDDYRLRAVRASTDTDSLAAQLRIFDIEARMERQRVRESGATKRTLLALERALGAERLALVEQYRQQEADRYRQGIDEAKTALDEALNAFRSFAEGIRDFRDGLRLDSNLSTLSPQERLAEARRQYEETLMLANRGDRDAMADLTSASQTYLEQAKSYFASTEDYAAIFNSVNASLAASEASATAQVTAAERQVDLLARQVSTLETLNTSVLTVAQLTRQLTDAVSRYFGAGGRGFAAGGYTGNLGIHQVAGVVHGREFVADAPTTARYRPQLEAMQAGVFRPQIVVAGNDNSAAFRDLTSVLSRGFSAQIDVLREELAAVRKELREARAEARQTANAKPRATAGGRQ